MHGTLYCQISMERLRPEWHRLSRAEQTEHLSGVQYLLTRYPLLRFDQYMPAAGDGESDFMLRWESDNPEALRDLVLELRGSDFFQQVETVKTMTGRTRPPEYVSATQMKQMERIRARPTLKRHVFILPVTRTADWWHFAFENRQQMVRQHVETAMPYNQRMHRRCYYCEGLDPQQDFIYYIEADDPAMVEEVYERVRRLRDAQHWASHHIAFHGVPVTLEDWCEQIMNPDLTPAELRHEGPHLHPMGP